MNHKAHHDVSLMNHKEHKDHKGNARFVFFVTFVGPKIVRR
jgi:hypothetical protein